MKLRVALAQQNPVIGDFDGNLARLRAAYDAACAQGAQLVLFPELALCGYPPKDLVERPAFVEDNRRALLALARHCARAAAVVGFIDDGSGAGDGSPPARGLGYNAAAVIERGRVTSVHHKTLLPTYDVFDEGRWFRPAASVRVVEVAGVRLGITVCEDVWNDADFPWPDFWPRRAYPVDPVAELCAQGAELLVNLSASPFELGKRHLRPKMLAAQARKHRRPLLFVNQVGGQDDLLFDGGSLGLDAHGELRARGREFTEDLVLLDVDTARGEVTGALPGELTEPEPSDEAAALAGLTMGLRDYAHKCGFSSVVLGLSGGIDSALVAALAARALGPEQVLGVSMPSRYTSEGTRSDARIVAERLGIGFREIPIEPMFAAFLDSLGLAPPGTPGQLPGDDVAAQNLQARLRGTLLMTLSNQQGQLVLTTGNKSELAVGYCTLYGDMNGGLAPLADVPKTLVYRLAAEVNREREVIPRETLERAPSAELRPDQTDQDTLPPYPLLDRLLEAHVEQGLDRAALVAAGFDAALVDRVVHMVRTSEYKRRQSAPGLKLTSKAFGPGRRLPIAQRWKG